MRILLWKNLTITYINAGLQSKYEYAYFALPDTNIGTQMRETVPVGLIPCNNKTSNKTCDMHHEARNVISRNTFFWSSSYLLLHIKGSQLDAFSP